MSEIKKRDCQFDKCGAHCNFTLAKIGDRLGGGFSLIRDGGGIGKFYNYRPRSTFRGFDVKGGDGYYLTIRIDPRVEYKDLIKIHVGVREDDASCIVCFVVYTQKHLIKNAAWIGFGYFVPGFDIIRKTDKGKIQVFHMYSAIYAKPVRAKSLTKDICIINAIYEEEKPNEERVIVVFFKNDYFFTMMSDTRAIFDIEDETISINTHKISLKKLLAPIALHSENRIVFIK